MGLGLGLGLLLTLNFPSTSRATQAIQEFRRGLSECSEFRSRLNCRVAQGSRQAVVAGCIFVWILYFGQAK